MQAFQRAAAGALAIMLLAMAAGTAAAQKARVTFVLVSDNYVMGEQVQPDGKARGGFARLAAIIKAERSKDHTVIVAHAGDTLSPSLMSGFDQGAHIIALTNLIGPDIFVPGNHEFDFGKAVFLKRMAEARFPRFAANLRDANGKPIAGFQDRGIVDVNGVKIGITGATFDETPRVSTSEDLRFAPTIDTLAEQASALRKEGADLVVGVVHAGRGQDFLLNAKGFLDLILSGHDHDLLVNYDERSAIAESPRDALQVVAIDVTITVTEKGGKRAAKWTPRFRIIDSADVKPDQKVAAAVANFERELSREMDVAVGETAVELDSRPATVRTREAAIGNLFADAMRASAKADVGLTNGGGIRAGKVYPAGSKITRRHILAELPFSNRLVTVEMTGKELKRAIEHGLRALPDAIGGFPQVSGLTIEADPTLPAGQRVTAIKVDGKPLEETRTYTVATNDFLARGGDGFNMIRDAKRLLPLGDAPLIANEVMVYLRRIGTLRTGVEGRIKLK